LAAEADPETLEYLMTLLAIAGGLGVLVLLLTVLWNVFVHPIQSAATVSKVALGLTGIGLLLAGVVGVDFVNGFIGVLLLVAAFMISRFQARRA
jgi:hypothetical protein